MVTRCGQVGMQGIGQRYHFISGLPRSGSTLLSSILKQNPRFTAGISDPLQMFVHSIIRDINSAVGMDSQVPISKRQDLLRDLFASYYKNQSPVCFNTNRAWCADTALLKQLFPNFKMIVCVRDVAWILNSFELLQRKNPLTIKALYHFQDLGTVHERCQMLMGETPGFAGHVLAPLLNLQQAMSSQEVDHLCFVEYDDLVHNPRSIMQQIYQFLEEPWFEHDFDNVADSYDEFDQQVRIQGLHEVKQSVKAEIKPKVLPAGLWTKYSSQSFWKDQSVQRLDLNWIVADKKPMTSSTITAQHMRPARRQL